MIKSTTVLIALLLAALAAHAQTVLPHAFQPNTPAKAEEVNANFNKVTTDINTLRLNAAYNVTRKVTITDVSGVGTASCDAGEFVVGGGCKCSGSNAAGTNFGVVFGCVPAGLGYVGGCFDYFFSSSYGHSPIEVHAICMKPVPSSSTSSAPGLMAPMSSAAPDDASLEAEQQASQLRALRNELSRMANHP